VSSVTEAGAPRTARLVLVTPDGGVVGSLRPVSVATPWWQDVEPVVRAVRERDGIAVTILRLLEAPPGVLNGGDVTYLAEVALQVADDAMTASPQLTASRQMTTSRQTTASRQRIAAVTEPWHGLLDDHPLRQTFARPGGPAADLAWAVSTLLELGRRPAGSPVQVKTWNLSSLWCIPVEDVSRIPAEDVSRIPAEDLRRNPVEDVPPIPVEVLRRVPVGEDVRSIPAEDLRRNPVEDVPPIPVEDLRRVPVGEDLRSIPVEDVRRDRVEEQTVWLKVVPPFFAHEGPLLECLAGARVPTLLAQAEGRSLLLHIPGNDLYAPELPVLLDMVALLVDLQRAWTGRAAELLALGLPDWRAQALPPAVADVVERTAEELSFADRATLDLFERTLPQRLADVAACGLDDTLVHGDFWPGNLRGDERSLTLLDWGDSGIGHPLLDQSAFLDRTPIGAADAISRHWARLWRHAVPHSDPERAFALLAPVAAARQAVVYRHFLDCIEPSEQPYHRTDPAERLRRTARLVRESR
jgi:Ser/Thr protein kinase RdoA (MazF antagonist)